MKNLSLLNSNVAASNVVLGLMRIADVSDEQLRTLVRTAVEEGINVFDHADVYGGAPHVCEGRFGEAISFTPAERERVVIQTKTGIRPGFFDFSADHIISSVEGSLAALRQDYLDILLLHRPDALVEPDEVARAFDQLHTAGKVLNFGVSNHTPGQIELLKRSVKQPLIVNQVQLSITHAPLVAQGIAANMQQLPQSISRDNGLLDYARLNGITLQAWSPFQKQWFDGTFLGDRENFAELNDVIDELSEKYSVTGTAIAVAWITRHPANFQVLIGSTNPARVREAASGSELPLTREEWYRVFTAAGYTLP